MSDALPTLASWLALLEPADKAAPEPLTDDALRDALMAVAEPD